MINATLISLMVWTYRKDFSCFIILFLDYGDVANMDLSNFEDDSLGKYNQKKF
jgi:hypothetical protein